MGKRGKFGRKRKNSQNGTIGILIALTIVLVIGIGFAFRNTEMPETPDNGAQSQLDASTHPPVLEQTEGTEVAVDAGETAPTAAPTEEPTERPDVTEEVTIATEETVVGEPVYQELQLIETEPDAVQTLEIMTFDDDEEYILLQIAMAEVGVEECVECAALVMRTVLNQVESPKFPNSLQRVIYAEEQFTPVWRTGSFYTVSPNDVCIEALELIRSGWDESEGALYYEACTDSSWHSRNLKLLYQHCNTRFYK